MTDAVVPPAPSNTDPATWVALVYPSLSPIAPTPRSLMVTQAGTVSLVCFGQNGEEVFVPMGHMYVGEVIRLACVKRVRYVGTTATLIALY